MKKNKSNTTNASTKSPLFDRVNSYLESKHCLFITLILSISAVFSLLLFDSKINMMGDDAEYILYGFKFAESLEWPTFRGPLYSILLSPFIKIFGINIVLLKALSLIMMLASLFFMYKAFFKRIPALLLFSCLFLLSINSYFLSYSSAVLSEPLFLMIQSLLLYVFCKFFINDDANKNVATGKLIVQCLIISFIVLLLTLTRTVGYAAVGVIAIFFLFSKQWKLLVLSVVSNVAMFGLFEVVKKAFWANSGSAYNLNSFFTKDMYTPDKGMEDFGGIVVRVFENINNYLSKFIAAFLGLTSSTSVSSIFITVVIVLLFCWGGYVVFKKSKALFFAALYVSGFCLANFIILHATWQQERFIVVYYPIILLIMLAGIYYFVQPKKGMQTLYTIIIIILFLGAFKQTAVKVSANTPALKANIRGNILYGLTPDWQNYIQASKWAAENAQPSENIAVRKPGTSAIYTTRNFYGIYAVPTIPKDSLNVWQPNQNKEVLVVDISSKIPVQLANYVTFVAQGNMLINGKETKYNAIYEINKEDIAAIIPFLDSEQYNYTTNFNQYKEDLLKLADNLIFSPEEMFNNLKSANVRYVLLASLRMHPEQYTGDIINTIHRYLNIIVVKYPESFYEVQSFGAIEPSTVVKLNY